MRPAARFARPPHPTGSRWNLLRLHRPSTPPVNATQSPAGYHHRVYLDNRQGGDDRAARIPAAYHRADQGTIMVKDIAPQLLQQMERGGEGPSGKGPSGVLDRETIVDQYERYAVIAAAEDLAHEVELRRRRQLFGRRLVSSSQSTA